MSETRPTPPDYFTHKQKEAYTKGWDSAGRGTEKWSGMDAYSKRNRGYADTAAWEMGHRDRSGGHPKWHSPNEAARRAAEMKENRLV